MSACIQEKGQDTVPSSPWHVSIDVTFKGSSPVYAPAPKSRSWSTDPWTKDVDFVFQRKKQYEDISLQTLLAWKVFSYAPAAARLRRYLRWRDAFRYNDAAITSLATETFRCWVTYKAEQAETKNFNKLLYTSFTASTTEEEVYNLLVEQLQDVRDDELATRFARYSQPNWDAYGAEAITTETINSARQFLRILPKTFGEPEMAPGGDGIIAMEWLFEKDHPLRKLFIDIGPGNVWSAYYRRSDGVKRTLPQNPITAATKSELQKLFDELSR